MRWTLLPAVLILFMSGCAEPDPAPPPRPMPFMVLKAEQLAAERRAIEEFWTHPTEASRPEGPNKGFAGVNNVNIAYRYFRKTGPSPAVVISSGRTEHMGKYREVAYDFWRNGYSVYIHDHRGQGESGRLVADPGRREMGDVVDFNDYVADLDTFVQDHVNKGDHPQKFLIGHSMGGGIATLYLLKHPDVFQRAVLASPMHKPDTAPLRLLGCWFMTNTENWRSDQWVFMTGPYEKPDEDKQIYTTDKTRLREWLASEATTPKQFRIGGMSRRWVAQACKASSTMLAEASKLSVPVMVLQSVDDEAVVPAAQDEFCKALPQNNRCHPHGKPVPYKRAKHELFIERDDVRNDVMHRTFDFFGNLSAAHAR